MKTTTLFSLCLSLLLCLVGEVQAQGQPQPSPSKLVSIDISARPLGDALAEFGKQAKLTVVFYAEDLGKNVSSKALTGTFTADAALAKLLSNTGLSYEYLDERTVAIRSAKAGGSSSGLGPADQMRMATVDAEIADGSKLDVAAEQKDSHQLVVQGEREKVKPLTGASIDLQRTADDVLPFTTFTAKDIESSGVTNLEEFFRARLSSNFSSSIPEQTNGNLGVPSDMRNVLNIRGMDGVTSGGEVVILLNGRRVPKQWTAINGENSTHVPGNFRGIPLSSIERIEILSSAGSAIYGEGATGGVVNIVTRQDYSGGQVTLHYEDPWHGRAPNRSVDLSYQLPLPGKSSLRVLGSMNRVAPISAGDRADVSCRRWRQLMLERAPESLLSWFGVMTGSTTNISGPVTGLFEDGSSRYTSVPIGYTGGQGLQPFVNREGILNYDLSLGGNDFDGCSMRSRFGPKTERATVKIGADKNLTNEWNLSFEIQVDENKNEGNGLYASTGFSIVPAGAPSNPFGKTVYVTFDDPRTKTPEFMRRDSDKNSQFNVTLRGALGAWRALADVSYNHYSNVSTHNMFDSPVGGWSNAYLAGTYNPFVDMNVTAPAAPEFYEEYIAGYQHYESAAKNYQATAKVSGPLLALPGGAVQLTAGLEWVREDRYKAAGVSQRQNSRTGAVQGIPGVLNFPSLLWISDTYAAYAEVSLPVLSEKQGIPLVNGVEVFTSGRAGRQERRSSTDAGAPIEYRNNPHVYAYGLRYDPFRDLALRASKSVGYKPPVLSQIAPLVPQPTNTITVTDPRRSLQPVSLASNQRLTGGNPELDPETSVSTNIGIILQPRWIKGMRVSVDYIESIRDDAIAGVTPQIVVNSESDLPERVQRGAPDDHPSGVGPITFVDARLANFRRISLKGVDVALQQKFENVFGGQMYIAAAATRNISLKIQAAATSLPTEQVSNPIAPPSRSIEWNANGQVGVERGRWSFGWSARYFDDVLVAPDYYVWQGDDRVESVVEHDFSMGYRFPTTEGTGGINWLLSNTSIRGGIKNVFDREPRFYAPSGGLGISPFDSISGRTIWMQINKGFD